MLAGFALLAILLPLDHVDDDPDEKSTADAVVVFVAAFFSLLVLSFAYAVLAGRTGAGRDFGVAAVEQLTLGGAFGLSTLLLLLGLHAVIRSYGANRLVFAPAQRLIRFVIAVVGPILILALQFSSALDVARFRTQMNGLDEDGSCGMLGLPNAVWVDLGIVSAAIVAVSLLWVYRNRVHQNEAAATIAAKAVLGLTVGVVMVASLAVPLLPAAALASPALEHGAVLVSVVGSLAVAYAAWASR